MHQTCTRLPGRRIAVAGTVVDLGAAALIDTVQQECLP
jgi:hypothetical protein